MLFLISKLQRKPERVRKKIAFVASAIITGIIVIIWLTSLSVATPETSSKSALSGDDVGPFQALTENLSVFFLDASETIQTAVSAFSGASDKAAPPQEKEVAPPVTQ
ncbi:MAG TPA: hypothetical protein DEF00_05205 [Candidatus Taylorbacteria bacterium]|nr:MAG: hypothetical protein UY03_C0015G0008 [Parcubacteria group bacterium GW2011_GWA2_47_64]KKU97241.1 MAG: hypothetical protein UY29_C0001G0035 [Parcubacteria group bacterium GW2011_GWC2_48_17]HBV01745.1 hypothetical protein [Candidatus Taylorbacteria bacterium]